MSGHEVTRPDRPGLAFEIGCPDCGSLLEPLATAQPTDLWSSIMLRCTVCKLDAQVVVALSVTHRPRFRAPNGAGQVRRKPRGVAA